MNWLLDEWAATVSQPVGKNCCQPRQHNIPENHKLYSKLLELLSKPSFFLATNISSVLFLIN